MPRMNGQELLRTLGSESAPQLCFLCGEDTFAAETYEKRILKKLTDGDAMAATVFDGQDLDLDRLSDACAFAPMFQPYNVVIIRDLDMDTLSAADTETLMQICKEPGPRVFLLISMRNLPAYEIKRGEPVFLPKLKKLVTHFEKNGVLCICEKRSAVQLGKSITDAVRRAGSDISREDAEELANRCLLNSTLIHAELEKLIACADGTPVTHDMLDALVAPLPDADVFRMARAVTGRNGPAAFKMLDELTAKSEDSKTILGILAILSSSFTDLYRAKLAMGASKQAPAVAADFAYAKNREFLVKNAMRDCGSMSLPQLRTCIRILRQTDKLCKSSRTPPRMLLEQAIVRMLSVKRDGTEVLQ